MTDGLNPVTGKNIGFNTELHDNVVESLDAAEALVRDLSGIFAKLYPKSDRGPEARARRSMGAILSGLAGLRIAMAEIRQTEGER